MGSSRLLIIFSSSLLLFLPTLTRSAVDPYFECQYAEENKGNFTANSTYRANLKRIVSQLSSLTDFNYGFHNLSAGKGRDKVFATALCTGDVGSPDQCGRCLNYTATELIKQCPWGKEVAAWSQFCMVRYANRDIFGQLDSNPRSCVYNTRDAPYVDDFSELLGDLLSNLSSEAAAGGPLRKYAAKGGPLRKYAADNKTFITSTVNGMVQCTPDLNKKNCSTCLNFAMSEFQKCCGGRIGCRVLRPNCILRVENGPLYNQTAIPPSSPAAPSPTSTPTQDSSHVLSYNAIIGLAVAGPTIVLVICVSLRLSRRRSESLSNRNPVHLRQWKIHNKASIDTFFKKHGSLAPKLYSYSNIKKMTNKFKEKLGQGGYGTVFKGKLPDGRLVAVKILSESRGNGDEFMNEVASISKTSHVNIVALLGFCYERSKRALVYEFMANGSLDKFIYNQGLLHQSRQLGWETLYDIALCIARGLEYLHQGCNTRILHFDIKPHNILLDESFCPKISDFGLSKLCERKESIISITGARGTVGYIAPEVFSRNFGQVSYKSDVYSYGMMVLEMVGGRRNIDVGVSKTSEIYFPSWIYKNLDQALNSSLHGVIAEEEEEITRKLIMVSLWCIQSDPSDRPSMTKVLEMLQGSLQSLPIPPRPFVSSPVRSPKTSTSS